MKKKDKSTGRPSATSTATDQEAWEALAASVKPLGAKAARTVTPPPVKTRSVTPAESTLRQRRATEDLPVTRAPRTPAALDRATSDKIKKGRWPVEGRCDLHGMTQTAAQSALNRFIRSAVRDGKRTVLVITGKGLRSGSGGVLKKRLPDFLAAPEIASHVIGWSQAAPSDGGDGAFYLRLRALT